MRNISPDKLSKFFSACYEKLGLKKELYLPVIEGLIQTSLRGVDSHGVRLFPHYVKGLQCGRINKRPKFTFSQTSPSTSIMDADHFYGITAGNLAMDKAIVLAKINGIGAVSVKNSTHFGAAAIYALKAAKHDMIGLCFTNVEALVLPYGGKKPFLGTNPFCFAAPMEGEEPFCLDMATSAMSKNRLMMHKKGKMTLPENCATDKEGILCTDPEKAEYLLHFGSYKGYGLALFIEIICSMLTGMPYGPQIKPMFSEMNSEKRRLSHLFMVMDISRFQEVSIFRKRMKHMIEEIRSIPPAQGYEKVIVANDPEKANFAVRNKTGIPVSDAEIEQFNHIAKELGIEGI